MKNARNILVLLTTLFIVTQALYLYYILQEDGDVGGQISTTLFFLIVVLLYTKKLGWARLVLTIFLGFYALLGLVAAIETGIILFYVLGIYSAFFALYIHISPTLKAAYGKQVNHDSIVGSAETHVLTSHNSFILKGEEFRYPSLVKRYKAYLIDILFILTLMIVIMILTNDHAYHTPIMIASAGILIFLYEPLLTVYSKTIGQRVMGVAVRQYDSPDRRIRLTNAYLRLVTKVLLGWLSFITIHFNPEHRAIHDFAGDSVMIDG